MIRSFIVILFLFSCSLYSQIVVKEDIETDTLDLFSTKKKYVVEVSEMGSKHPGLSMLGDIVFPGLGHKYLGKEKKAFVFITTEVVSLTSAIFLSQYAKRRYSDSKSYASIYGNTASTRPIDDDYWNVIGNKYSLTSDQYNRNMELNRTFDKKYTDDADQWRWSSEIYQKEYRNMRVKAARLKIASSFFIGAMVLNRVVSFLDARIISKHISESMASREVSFRPSYCFTDRSSSIEFTASF